MNFVSYNILQCRKSYDIFPELFRRVQPINCMSNPLNFLWNPLLLQLQAEERGIKIKGYGLGFAVIVVAVIAISCRFCLLPSLLLADQDLSSIFLWMVQAKQFFVSIDTSDIYENDKELWKLLDSIIQNVKEI